MKRVISVVMVIIVLVLGMLGGLAAVPDDAPGIWRANWFICGVSSSADVYVTGTYHLSAEAAMAAGDAWLAEGGAISAEVSEWDGERWVMRYIRSSAADDCYGDRFKEWSDVLP